MRGLIYRLGMDEWPDPGTERRRRREEAEKEWNSRWGWLLLSALFTEIYYDNGFFIVFIVGGIVLIVWSFKDKNLG